MKYAFKLIFLVFIYILVSCKSTRNKTVVYIGWKEHIIDDFELSNQKISGGDGLVIADLDNDGFEDIISVYESDWVYDGVPRGHIRIAFGTSDPEVWELVTLGEGEEVGAVEDVTVADINNDGYLDVVAACELSHIIYFENPIENIRTQKWERLIPKLTLNRGSFIRVFAADLNNDGKVEIIAANKGSQAGHTNGAKPKPVSYFEIIGNPLNNDSWKETELINVLVPINSEPVDIDADGDVDIMIGSRGENRIIFMENQNKDSIQFLQHNVEIAKTSGGVNSKIFGFNMDYMDLNNDTLLDIVLVSDEKNLIWLEQPTNLSEAWIPHTIGTITPDLLVGFVLADINNDSFKDVMVGSYSRGPRTIDGDLSVNDKLGCIAWFEHPKNLTKKWKFHPIVRRKRGMYDKFIARDLDNDGDMDFIYTRGNSHPYDGVYWLEQIEAKQESRTIFTSERIKDSKEVPFTNAQLNQEK